MHEAERIIREGMAKAEIRYEYQLAERLGMKRQTLSYRLKHPTTFTAGELKAMCNLFCWSDLSISKFIRSM